MINNVVLISGVQRSDSDIDIRLPTLFQVVFPFMVLQNIEQSSLCYILFYWLPALKKKKISEAISVNFFEGKVL